MDTVHSKPVIFKMFIKTYFDFLNFIMEHSNENNEFKKFYRKNQILKRSNIKMFIRVWNETINAKYFSYIINEDIDYFLHKNYDEEFSTSTRKQIASEYKIHDCLKYIKKIYHTLEQSTVEEFKSYMKNLAILCELYHR